MPLQIDRSTPQLALFRSVLNRISLYEYSIQIPVSLRRTRHERRPYELFCQELNIGEKVKDEQENGVLRTNF